MDARSRRKSLLAKSKLFVSETGAGRPIVFLHGNPDTHEVWDPVAESLASTHRCITPDLPGFGASPPDLEPSLEGFAATVRELVDELGLGKFHLVVHDVGGTYGLAFAALHPERLSALTIFNTNFFPDYRWHFWGRVWRLPVIGELAMLFGNRALFVSEVLKAAPKLSREYASRAYDSYSPKTRRQVLRFYRYMSSERLQGWDTRLLEAIANVPYQVIWGDQDPYIPKAMAERFGGVVTHFAESSHWVMAEDPGPAAELIRRLDERAERHELQQSA